MYCGKNICSSCVFPFISIEWATLKMYNGKTDVTIADDVFSYKVIDKKNVVMLIDYNVSSYEGDLKYYRGKDGLEDIDDNVSFIFGGKMI